MRNLAAYSCKVFVSVVKWADIRGGNLSYVPAPVPHECSNSIVLKLAQDLCCHIVLEILMHEQRAGIISRVLL